MPTAYSYRRFSDLTQKKGNSLVRQYDPVPVWCERNGYTLDLSIRADKGRSAFHGHHIKYGHLGRFLKLVEEGKIEKGSALLVERLDRYTRENQDDGYRLVSDLINAGVDIVTLIDEEKYTAERLKNDPMASFKIMFTLFQSHAASKIKSEMTLDNWRRKRTRMREGSQKHNRFPSWFDPKTKEVIPEKADLIRRLFTMASSGLGSGAISRQLNKEGVPPLRGKQWYSHSVQQFLTSRTVLGEYQPHRIINEQRIPDGDPIKNFYAPIISPEVFNQVQRLLADRSQRNFRGTSDDVPNLFTGLVYSLYDGGTYHCQGSKVRGKLYKRLVPYRRRENVPGSMDVSLNYDPFESAFLTVVKELDIVSLFATNKGEKRQELDRLESERFEIETTLKTIKERIKKAKEIDSLLNLLEEQDTTRKDIIRQIEKIRSELMTSETRIFEDLLTTLSDPSARAKIAGSLRLLIDRIDVLPILTGTKQYNVSTYLLYVLIHFANGKIRIYATDEQGTSVPTLKETEDQCSQVGVSIVSKSDGSFRYDGGVQRSHPKNILRDLIDSASPEWKPRLEAWLATHEWQS
jgi:DNA invertase Pin-like site-specific DNA recombinase